MLKDENLIFDERKIEYCTKRIAYQIFESRKGYKTIIESASNNNK